MVLSGAGATVNCFINALFVNKNKSHLRTGFRFHLVINVLCVFLRMTILMKAFWKK